MTPIFISLAVVLLFSITDGMSDAWIFRDFKNRKMHGISAGIPYFHSLNYKAITALNENKKWHQWQALRQGLVIAFAAFYAKSWPMLALGASVFWIVHDGIVNIVGLDRSFFYVGQTAAIDRFFQRFKNPNMVMAIAKFLLLAGSITLLILKWKSTS